MPLLTLTTWNLEWFGMLLEGRDRKMAGGKITTASGKARQSKQRQQIAAEIRAINPDILCLQEGPKNPALLRDFCRTDLQGDWVVIERDPGDPYEIQGEQYIWFLMKKGLAATAEPFLLSIDAWREATRRTSDNAEHDATWPVRHPALKTGSGKPKVTHDHFRHPQTLVCRLGGRRVDLIGLHLKSKFVKDQEKAGPIRRKPEAERTADEVKKLADIEDAAIAARIKLTTEAINVRHYIDARFGDEPNPLVFVLGDLNDGPGKEYFERIHLFHDLVGNLQGEVFFARRFLNHCLFDYSPTGDDSFRWSVRFQDPWEPARNPLILLDHILFSQGAVDDGSPVRVPAKAGLVEHEIHTQMNAVFDGHQGTSDHRPVSCRIKVEG